MEIKKISNQFNSFDHPWSQESIKNPKTQHDLNLIYTHFSKIPELMTRLKIKNIQLHNPLQIMKKLLLTSFELLDVFSEKSEKRLFNS